MTSSSVVAATPRARTSAAAPSMMRARVARPFAVRFWTCRSIFDSGACGPMSPNTTRLAGRTALVTGSTAGLGAAVATALAQQGALVIVTGRNTAPRARGIVDRVESGGGSAAFVAADLGARPTHVRRLAEEATALAGGRIDILVNNAAMLITPTPTAQVPAQLVHEA